MVDIPTEAEQRMLWPNGRISLKEHYDALRAADKELREAVRLGDLALQTERDRRYAEKEAGRETALAAALLAVKEKNEAALASLATATAVLAKTTVADKEAANEWRGTVNDLISRVGGARGLWAALAALAAFGLLVWGTLRSNMQSNTKAIEALPQTQAPKDSPRVVK